MTLKKIDLILHPVRLRILQALYVAELNTQEISAYLPDVATSSIYRHLRLLLEAGVVVVAKTEQVRGVQQKYYKVVDLPTFTLEDFGEATAEDHLRYFTAYTLSLQQGFATYLQHATTLDLLAERVGYREVVLHATLEELDNCFQEIRQAVDKLRGNKPRPDRRAHKLATITHPIGKRN